MNALPQLRSRGPGVVKDLAGVTAAILAGGLGTRLRSAVPDSPKVLAEVRGRPFLAFLLDQLITAGLRTVVLCTGYLGERVWATFGDRYRSLRLLYSAEPVPLGTAGALRLALPLFASASVLVMNGDSYCGVDLPAFWAWHGAHGGSASLAVVWMDDTRGYGRVRLGADGPVVQFDEKGGDGSPGWINAGIYVLEHSVIEAVPAHGAISLEYEVFPALISRGLRAYRSAAPFLDIGTPEAYAVAVNFFAKEQVR